MAMTWISKEKKVGHKNVKIIFLSTVIINYHSFSPLERQKNVGRTGILSNQVGSEIRNKLFKMLPSKNNQKVLQNVLLNFTQKTDDANKKKILPKFRSKIKFCETQHFVPSKSDFCKK